MALQHESYPMVRHSQSKLVARAQLKSTRGSISCGRRPFNFTLNL